jgi:hypothetical protein
VSLAAPITELPLVMGSSAPGSASVVGYAHSGVTGALPSTFTTIISPRGAVARATVDEQFLKHRGEECLFSADV